MTEAEWLASKDPGPMLNLLTRGPGQTPDNAVGLLSAPAGRRKLRLFACACCRAVWHLLTDPRSRRAVEAAERYADGEVVDLNDIRLAAHRVGDNAGLSHDLATAADAASHCCQAQAEMAAYSVTQCFRLSLRLPPHAQAALTRDVFGNPHRPRPGDAHVGDMFVCEKCGHAWERRGVHSSWYTCRACGEKDHVRKFRVRDSWARANDSAALKLARSIYDERRFEDLPVLADALADGGCDDEGVLGHLRGRERCWSCVRRGETHHRCPFCGGSGWDCCGPHARGCWVVDMVLGRG